MLNKRIILPSAIFSVLMLSTSLGLTAEQRHGAKYAPVTPSEQQFVQALQNAVKQHDCAWVAKQVLYPIRVESTGKGFVQIGAADEFIENCSQILSDNVQQAIMKADIQNLIKSSKGIVLGDGDVWLMSLSKKENGPFRVYITGINNRVSEK